jgi:hypothetical protein
MSQACVSARFGASRSRGRFRRSSASGGRHARDAVEALLFHSTGVHLVTFSPLHALSPVPPSSLTIHPCAADQPIVAREQMIAESSKQWISRLPV